MRFFYLKIVVASLLVSVAVYGQSPFKLKTHKITISGTSSLHDWQSEAQTVNWSGLIKVESSKVHEIKDVSVGIVVRSIKSEKGNTMDNKTYDAFDADKNPNITFKSTSVTVTNDQFKSSGTLTMAGNSKTVELSGTTKVLPNGDVQITGSHKINMTEYKMKPPKAVMGTIKVGPEVTVNFDLTVTPGK
jgi:polyisoprenoid-binding protein YceI